MMSGKPAAERLPNYLYSNQTGRLEGKRNISELDGVFPRMGMGKFDARKLYERLELKFSTELSGWARWPEVCG